MDGDNDLQPSTVCASASIFRSSFSSRATNLIVDIKGNLCGGSASVVKTTTPADPHLVSDISIRIASPSCELNTHVNHHRACFSITCSPLASD